MILLKEQVLKRLEGYRQQAFDANLDKSKKLSVPPKVWFDTIKKNQFTQASGL